MPRATTILTFKNAAAFEAFCAAFDARGSHWDTCANVLEESKLPDGRYLIEGDYADHFADVSGEIADTTCWYDAGES